MDKYEKALAKQVKQIEKEITCGDTINLKYDRKTIATYDFVEFSPDSKTPTDWLMGVFCFGIDMMHRDTSKVTLEYVKAKKEC